MSTEHHQVRCPNIRGKPVVADVVERIPEADIRGHRDVLRVEIDGQCHRVLFDDPRVQVLD